MDGLSREIEDALERLFDGALDDEGRVALERAAETRGDLREEIAWFESIAPDLEAMGDAIVSGAPEIDVRANVMAAIREGVDLPAAEVVPFPPAPKGRGASARWGLTGLAAAAALTVMSGLGYILSQSATNSGSTPPTEMAATPAMDDEFVDVSPAGDPGLEPTPSDVPISVNAIEETDPEPIGTVAEPRETRLAALDRETVLQAFRDGRPGDEALKRLVDWAMLRLDEAEALAADPDAAPEAIAAASGALDPEEAARNLRTVVGHKPNDFYVRLQLARALDRGADAGLENAGAEQAEQLAALKTMDTENALYDYMDAVRRLEMNPPDLKGALDVLAQAEQMSTASAHSLEAAQARQMALDALGADPDTAHLLSAFTAGSFEYEQLLDLATRLLSAGESYEQAGDTDTAAALYEAALTMGQQLDAGADLTQEQLAAFDIQQSALEYLAPLADLLGQASQLEQITTDLVGGILNLRSYIEEVNTQIFANLDDAVMGMVADVIFQNGDLNLFEALRP